ncbi:cell division protein FtsZ [Pararhodospirillum photometricum]|nr:cell division protein FtsZ [Pararhodospirillum photometricum]
MALTLNIPEGPDTPHLRPRITVVGVGGAGGNAVNNMIEANLNGVDFVVANTDAQALSHSRTSRRIQLGTEATRGLGAGARPEVGRVAAEEAIEAVAAELQGSNMVFITAGMGGGTGTGAAPVVASVARELGILTVGVVTKPFQFEGAHRMRLAEAGIDELAQFVDTLIIIPNQNLFHVANEKTTFADAFKLADEVLYSGVRSVTDLMINPGLINLDFADVRTVMHDMGRAMMGTGEAEGERRALDAAEAAIANPLLEDTSMRGARGVLINITGGTDVTLYEVDEAANRIREEVETEAHIIFGSSLDDSLHGRIRVSVVATGISAEAMGRSQPVAPAQPAPQAAAPVQTAPRPVAEPRPVPKLAQARPAPRVAQAVASVAARAAAAAHTAAAPAAGASLTSAGRPEVPPRPVKNEQSVRLLESLVLEANAKRDAQGTAVPPPAPTMPTAPVSQPAAPQPTARPLSRPAPTLPLGGSARPAAASTPEVKRPLGARLSRDAFIPQPPVDTGSAGRAAQAAMAAIKAREATRYDVPPPAASAAPVHEDLHSPEPAYLEEEETYARLEDEVDLPVTADGTMAPAMRAPVFPPLPETSRGAYAPPPPRPTRASEPEDLPPPPPPAPTRERAEKPSLLARITGLGSRASSHPEPREAQAQQPPLMAKTLSADPRERPVASQGEDHLEIPAFLRRQAN